jgi:hypothetical protein
MSMLPRDLVELQAHYQSLVEGVEAGTLSYDDAVEALSHIASTDAAGVVWRLDISGNFLAAPVGMEPQLTDPHRFVERSSPGPWDQPSTTPAFLTPQPTGPGPQFGDMGFPAQHAYGTQHLNEFPAAPYQTSGGPQTFPATGKSSVASAISALYARFAKKPRRPVASHVEPTGSTVLETLRRFRTPLIVTGAAVAAALIWTSGTDSPSTDIEVTAPTGTSSTGTASDGDIINPAAGESTDPATPTAGDTTADASNSAGIAQEAQNLLNLLSSGEAGAVSTAVAEPGKGNRALLRRAQFAGYAAVGLVLKVVSVETNGNRDATAAVQLLSPNGDVIVEGTVELVRSEERWLLRSWPELG